MAYSPELGSYRMPASILVDTIVVPEKSCSLPSLHCHGNSRLLLSRVNRIKANPNFDRSTASKLPEKLSEDREIILACFLQSKPRAVYITPN